MRCRGMPLPMWMCGALTSMPSLTRNGRPSFSFSSSPPSGSTSTALRVSSALMLLPRCGLEVLDLGRLDLVGRLEAEDLSQEGEMGRERALDVLRLAEPVPLAFEGDVRVGNTTPPQRVDDHL